MFYLNLNDMEFITCHGVLTEEKKTPQKFMVDLRIENDQVISAAHTDHIDDALNYADVYQVVRQVMMDNNYDLIETIAKEIGEAVVKAYPSCICIETKVTKVNPPIEGFVGTVSCEYVTFGRED